MKGRPSSFKTMRRCNYYGSCCYVKLREVVITLSGIFSDKFLGELIFERTANIFTRMYKEYLEIYFRDDSSKKDKIQFYQRNANCANYEDPEARNARTKEIQIQEN